MQSFTEKERKARPGERAWQAGYDARYEGKPITAAPYATGGALVRRWRDGWNLANEELS